MDTNHGPMTAEEIVDHLRYASWLWNKTYWGAKEHTLRSFFGDVPHEQFTARFIRENRE